MLSLTSNLTASVNIPVAQATQDKAVTPNDDGSGVAEKAKPGVSVTISGAAMQAQTAQKTSNSDIDDSGLSDNVKQLLKMIREIKKQIAEKQAEMAAVMADQSLSPEQARAKLSGLQAALSGLQAGLITAQTSLAKAMKGMSAGDAIKAAGLAMK
ncbi:hypothetical protein BFW86_20850 [Pseudomonas fluorescens]|nr:hypothetical protein BFW86_20850 [Pseudomonas fluorescens]